MISIKDSFVLARTKLRTRKIRTGLTVGVSGILFGLLASLSLFIAGLESSVDTFSKEGFGTRYFAQANYFNNNNVTEYNLIENSDVITQAETIQKQLVIDKTAEAKRLQIQYDPTSEIPPVTLDNGRKILNLDSRAGTLATQEYFKKNVPKETPEQIIKKRLAQYNPSKYYSSSVVQAGSGSWATMKNGKEEFKQATSSQSYQNPFDGNADPISLGVTMMDNELTKPFILKNQQWKSASGTIPVIVTYGQAEKLLNLKKLSVSASSKEKVERIQYIREHAAGKQVITCYRSSSSMQAIQATITQDKEIKQNAANKEYVKPKRITTLPAADQCTAPLIKTDTRTTQEKKDDTNQEMFAQKFDGALAPVQSKFTFEVVGVSPGYDTNMSSSLSGIISSLFVSTLGNSWVVPKGMYDSLPATAKLETAIREPSSTPNVNLNNDLLFVEFADFNSALEAVKAHSCSLTGCGSNQSLYIIPFGGGAITFAQIKQEIAGIVKYIIMVVVAIAAIIMLGTIGRAIADSRRETAVFRAIGAKRRDISAIYFMYSLLLSVRTIIFMAVLSLFIVQIIDYFNYQDATINAQLLFGSSDLTKSFHLIGFNVPELLGLAGLIVATGFVGSIIPLLRAIRRNPISDMRDDT